MRCGRVGLLIGMRLEEAKELAPLYALGALDPLRRAEFERAIDMFGAELSDELSECRRIVSILPLAVNAEIPPVSARDRLFAVVTHISQAKDVKVKQVSTLKPVSPPAGRADWLRWGLLAATVALAVLAGRLWNENVRLESSNDTMFRRAASLEVSLEHKQAEFDHLLSQTTRLVLLAGQPISPGARARLLWDTDRNVWVIYVFDLPLATAEKDYQLWYITRDQRKISASVFRPNERGRSELKIDLPGEIAANIAAAAVTLEPRGGSAQPTGAMYLLASL
jgi:anti-sigma-K factor RskA